MKDSLKNTLWGLALFAGSSLLYITGSSAVKRYCGQRLEIISPAKMEKISDKVFLKSVKYKKIKSRDKDYLDYKEAIEKVSHVLESAEFSQRFQYRFDNYYKLLPETRGSKRVEWGKIDSIFYNQDYMASIKISLENGLGDCDDVACAIAATLSDNGFPPYILYARNKKESHAVFVYKTQLGKYGSIGSRGRDLQYPNKSLEELIRDLGYDSGYIQDLRIKHKDFITNTKNNIRDNSEVRDYHIVKASK